MDIQVREREPTSMRGGAEPKPSGGGMSPQTVKILISVALLALAGLVLAWQLGVFDSGPDTTVSPIFENQQEEQKAWEEAQRERQRTHPPAVTPPPSGS